MKRLPHFKFEKDLWKKGIRVIGGIDEVGRGALAGPVVTGCVIFNVDQEIEILIHDSKKLTPKQREVADIWIKSNCLAYGIGSASVAEIDKYGIVAATDKAFRRAIQNCVVAPQALLIDAFYIPYVKGINRKKQTPIVGGDAKSVSIAAASIIAKVHRDKLMAELSEDLRYSKYKWNENKGYGTKTHREAIKEYGKTRLHRVSFLLKLN